MSRLLFLIFVFCIKFSFAADIYPTHWWVGMKNPKLELMIHQPQAGNYNKAAISYAGVMVEKVSQVEYNNYLFTDLRIALTAKPGVFKIKLTGNAAPLELSYELLPRRK